MSTSRTFQFLAIALLCTLLETACERQKGSDNEAQQAVESIVDNMSMSQVGEIEILCIPGTIESRVAITPDQLDARPYYRLIVTDVREGILQGEMVEAMKSLAVKPSSRPGDIRWGVIFHAVQGERIQGLYFDRIGHHGAVGATPVEVDGGFFNWLDGKFSHCFQ